MDFNQNYKRHLELLKASPTKLHINFKTQQEFDDWYKSAPPKDENFPELRSYVAAMNEEIHYQNKIYYVELIETMLQSPDFDGFIELVDYYKTIEAFGEKLQDNLILLEPNDKSKDFSLLIGDLIMHFDRREELTDEQLRAVIQTILIKIKQDYFET